MANAEAQTEMMKLYASFWQGKRGEITGIADSLNLLAEGYEKTLNPMTYRLYTAALADLTQAEIVLAFARASEECKAYFPSPATLREFSGRAVTGDPLAAEAKAELLKLIAGMRGPHGPMLKPILGPILYGTEDDPKDKDGNRTHAPIRGESTPFPIARRTEAALVRLGWGDRSAGIALLADHPAVRRKVESGDEQYRQNQLRAGDEILKRWTDAYREV